MFGLTLAQLLLQIVALLVVTALSGFLLALAARLIGDRGPAYDGKQTLNPLEHLDLLAIIPFILDQTGWIKPMVIDPRRLKPQPIVGAMIATIAPLAVLVVGTGLLWSGRWLLHAVASTPEFVSGVDVITEALFETSVWFAILNLLPLPPLAAGLVLQAVAPAAAATLARFGLPIRIGLIVVLFTGWPQAFARPLFEAIAGLFGARI